MKQVIGLVVARRLLAFVATCMLTVGAAAQEPAADPGFEPFDVYIDQEAVMARCGPGGDYYRTDPLRHGQRLEVYLETEQGWLGVRPPEGSFSWVPADSVELDRGGKIGKVTEEGTLSWIGTHLGKARKYMWQVQLAEGETVAILGKAEREGPDGPQLWYRIAPPAGEFRWVHREQVVDDPELLLRDKPPRDDRVAQTGLTLAAPDQSEVAAETYQPAPERTPRSILRPRSAAATEAGDSFRSPAASAAGDVALTTLEAPEAIPLKDQTPLVDWPVSESAGIDPLTAVKFLAAGALGRAPSGDAAAPERSQATAAARALPAAQPFSYEQPVGSGVARVIQPPLVSIASEPTVRSIGAAGWNDTSSVQAASGSEWVRGNPRVASPAGSPMLQSSPMMQSSYPTADYSHLSLDSLQLELSRRMVAAARVADVEGLRLAADNLVATAASETERQRAMHLAQRVRQYQSIASRRDGDPLPIPELTLGAGNVIPAATMSPPPGQVNFAGVGTGQPEVSGYLVQVYSARPESPPFALTDASGRTTHYVSPTPGFNLRRLLNQHVIVAGQAGYDTGLDTPHIIASTAVRSPEPR